MSDNRLLSNNIENAQYNSITAAINYEYSKKYNYDFIYYRPYLNDKENINLYNCPDPNSSELRHAAWSKLLSTQLALQLDYDYVVYIDSDCIFKNFEISLEEFIAPYSDKNIITVFNYPWNYKPCTGFYICKVNDITRQNIKDWYNINLPNKNKKHAWEQDGFWLLYPNFNIENVNIITFLESENQFLRHLYSYSNTAEYRKSYFINYLNNNSILYEENINQINCIEYNTDINDICKQYYNSKISSYILLYLYKKTNRLLLFKNKIKK